MHLTGPTKLSYFYYDYNQLQQKAVSLEEQQKENDAAIKKLTSENEELKKQLTALQEQLSKNNDNQ